MGEARERPGAPSATLLLGFLLLLALALRAWNAWTASLHLDDFHSLYHARSDGPLALLQGLRADNHPPLSFLLLQGARALLGESELALRLPAILCGLGTVALTWRCARHLGGTRVRAAAALLVACSSLHVELSSDLRMYALLGLAVAGLLDATLDILHGEGGRARWVLYALLGLHAHYHALHALVVLVAGALALWVARPELRPRLRRMGACLGLVLAASAPWYLGFFPSQLGHGLSPGGSRITPLLLAEGMVHLLFYRLSLGGALLRPLYLAAGGVALVLSLALLPVGLAALRRGPGARPAGVLFAFALAWGLPGWTALAAALSERAGFEWRYLAGSVAPLAILVAAQAQAAGKLARLRRAAVWVTAGAALLLSLQNARHPGFENYRDAVRWIASEVRPGDALVAADWQPGFFPHGMAWDYYAPRALEPGTVAPEELDLDAGFALPVGTDLGRFGRVFVLARSIPGDAAFLRRLRDVFGEEEARRFGTGVWALRLERAPPDSAGGAATDG